MEVNGGKKKHMRVAANAREKQMEMVKVEKKKTEVYSTVNIWKSALIYAYKRVQAYET